MTTRELTLGLDKSDIFRIRPRVLEMGIQVQGWVVTPLDSRRRIGINHLSQKAACRWVHNQGKRHIGGCWHIGGAVRS